ncbi:MAG: FKBP-type peptidyl-prolyl cis-trans isomerase [Thermoanaerobaculia bacterium]
MSFSLGNASGIAALATLALSILPLAGLAFASDDKTAEAAWTKNPSGLEYQELKVGEGLEAKPGKTVDVHYTGWLLDGTQFDTSVGRGKPFSFRLGAGEVIRGWDEGVAGMKVGGKRKLRIPADLGYGARGAGGVIPGNATLVFDVELLGVR